MKMFVVKKFGREIYKKKSETRTDLKMFFYGLFVGILVMQIVIAIFIM